LLLERIEGGIGTTIWTLLARTRLHICPCENSQPTITRVISPDA